MIRLRGFSGVGSPARVKSARSLRRLPRPVRPSVLASWRSSSCAASRSRRRPAAWRNSSASSTVRVTPPATIAASCTQRVPPSGRLTLIVQGRPPTVTLSVAEGPVRCAGPKTG